MSITIVIFLFIFSLRNHINCISSNINIQPSFVILYSSDITKFICTKEKDDYRGFEVNLAPSISSKDIQTFINPLSDTAIEITIKSYDYIGAFNLICSSIGERNIGSYADIHIGKPPGLLVRADRCVVYYDEYIDCTVRSPVMVDAILHGLKYKFRFTDPRIYSRDTIYRQQPKLIKEKIDSIKKTLTFRWFRKDGEQFPLGSKMIINGTLRYFGTTTHTMDMTPIFRISSNFTVQPLSSTDLRIQFNHRTLSSPTFCHGNLTRDDELLSLNQRENARTFDETTEETIRVTSLSPDTQYRLCFNCRRDAKFDTISEMECRSYKTLKLPLWYRYRAVIIIFCLLLFTVVILLIIWNSKWAREKLQRWNCFSESMSCDPRDSASVNPPLIPQLS